MKQKKSKTGWVREVVRTVINVVTLGSFIEMMPCKLEASVGDAAQAILDSSMWSGDKQEALGLLKRNQSGEYYKTFIKIINSSAFVSDKLDMIRTLNEKY